MRNALHKSIIQWTVSFVLVDVAALILAALSCIVAPDTCGIGAVFLISTLYYPFGLLLAKFGTGIGSVTAMLSVPVFGLLVHITFGTVTGMFLRDKRMTWAWSIAVATAVSMTISFAPFLAGNLSSATSQAPNGIGPVRLNHPQEAWRVHNDDTHPFEISYVEGQSVLGLRPGTEGGGLIGTKVPDDGLRFLSLSDGSIEVRVYRDIGFDTIDAWLAATGSEAGEWVLERKITIADRDTIVVHPSSEIADQPIRERRTYFLNEDDLYEIWTDFPGYPEAHATVWESFRFKE